MPFVNPTLPNDGESADAADISDPFLELLAVFNGHIGADNLEPGTVDAAISNGAITTDKLAGSAVTTPKIADASVTPAKVGAAVAVTTHTSNVVTPLLSTRMYIVTALDGNTAIAAPSGTPYDGQSLTLRITASGGTRTLTWNSIYRAIGLTIPTSVASGKVLYVTLVYNSSATKWDVVSYTVQA